jgi:hypothetical protein
MTDATILCCLLAALGAFKGMNMTRQTPASQILVLSEEEVMAHMEVSSLKGRCCTWGAHPQQCAAKHTVPSHNIPAMLSTCAHLLSLRRPTSMSKSCTSRTLFR